jgi:hypothetical protein
VGGSCADASSGPPDTGEHSSWSIDDGQVDLVADVMGYVTR